MKKDRLLLTLFALAFDEFIAIKPRKPIKQWESIFDATRKQYKMDMASARVALGKDLNIEAAFVLLYEGTGQYRASDATFIADDLEKLNAVRKGIRVQQRDLAALLRFS
jgi:hypothetical protein